MSDAVTLTVMPSVMIPVWVTQHLLCSKMPCRMCPRRPFRQAACTVAATAFEKHLCRTSRFLGQLDLDDGHTACVYDLVQAFLDGFVLVHDVLDPPTKLGSNSSLLLEATHPPLLAGNSLPPGCSHFAQPLQETSCCLG